MRLVTLFSGGKDSTYVTYIAQQKEWNVQYLLSMISESQDSYMFHVPNIELTPLLSEAIGIPLIQKRTTGEKEIEIEDLKDVLKTLDIDGILTGAIASNYQYNRIKNICDELNLKLVAPLWGKEQVTVLKEEINAGFYIIIVGVYAQGFDEVWLGRRIDENCITNLINLHEKYKINIAGEGGEFETLVIDGPNFEKKLVIEDYEIKWEKNSGIFKVKNAKLQEKK